MTFNVDITGIDETIRKLEEYATSVDEKAHELCERLASIGATNVSLQFSRAIYTGINDFSVNVEESGGVFKIIVSGQSVAFVEFGAGIKYGEGHPLASAFGAGVGTYPGQTHAFDPRGWYLPKSKWSAAGDKHTYGNPPNMPMYNTTQDLKQEIERITREVFSA